VCWGVFGLEWKLGKCVPGIKGSRRRVENIMCARGVITHGYGYRQTIDLVGRRTLFRDFAASGAHSSSEAAMARARCSASLREDEVHAFLLKTLVVPCFLSSLAVDGVLLKSDAFSKVDW